MFSGFVIGNNLDSLSLSYFLQCKKLNVNLLLTNKSTNSINTYHHKKNVIEKGHYTFALNDESYLSLSLLKSLHLKQKVVERNRYSNNVSFLDVKERKYKINKYLFRIIYNLLKDYFSNKSINIGKNETLNNFILQHFDKKICDNLIAPYCYHYFNYSPENVLMRSFFPQFVEKIEGKKSLIKFLFSKKASLSSISKKQKIFRFMGGNNLLLGREVIKCNEIILCLNPSELKYFLKKSKLEKKKKNILLQYLSKYDTSKIRITNVCFKKNVLPLSHSLESLLLIKKNEKHKIISLLYDSNIFPNCIPIEEEDDKDIFQTRLRFLSRECDHTLSNIEINYFLENVLKIKEKPDLVVGNTHHVFAFNKNVDVIFKKLIHKYLKRIKIFWSFCFFKNLEYCLRQAKEFSKL
ncbi:hypothetical protein PFNF54_01807 [Plasmodium falciparum NF54]|uniref:Amine oxidase domain-containing protein n=1 Tax=Plasmodium falciparum (isolate NF54) TaxID=5843 RepID=W7K7G3_PLAFO|nr:hypothetical protein PFNF54_01807 [Plasmodium falciparum NF54]